MKHKNNIYTFVKAKFNLLLVMLAFVSTSAFAFDSPKKMLEVTTSEILQEIEANSAAFEADRNKLYAFVETKILPHVDVPYVSKLILAKNYKNANPTQLAAFEKEFSSFLVKTYASGLFAYDGQTVTFSDPQFNKDETKAIVKAKLLSDNGETNGEFKLIKNNNSWKLYNAEVEDVNLVQNFRTSYNDIIAQRGLDGLIADLKAKNDEYR